MKRIILTLLIVSSFFSAAALAAVNVNSADAEALAQLTGIGPAKASAIIEDRKDRGEYESLDQLTRVSGIGAKTVDSLRDEATVGSSE